MTIGGIIFGISTFRQYRDQKRSEAAALTYGLLEESVKDILEIADYAEKFQYIHLDDFLMFSLIPNADEETPFPARPSRIIHNIIRRLKREVYPLIAQISREEGIKIKKVLEQLDTSCKALASAIHLSLDKKAELLHNSSLGETIENDCKKIKLLLEQADKILNPVVEKRNIFAVCVDGFVKLFKWFRSILFHSEYQL